MVSEATRTQEELIARYIGRDPRKPGLDNSWLVDDGIPVWAIIGYWQGAAGNIEATARGFDISIDAVKAAVAFYERHQAVIDARLDW